MELLLGHSYWWYQGRFLTINYIEKGLKNRERMFKKNGERRLFSLYEDEAGQL